VISTGGTRSISDRETGPGTSSGRSKIGQSRGLADGHDHLSSISSRASTGIPGSTCRCSSSSWKLAFGRHHQYRLRPTLPLRNVQTGGTTSPGKRFARLSSAPTCSGSIRPARSSASGWFSPITYLWAPRRPSIPTSPRRSTPGQLLVLTSDRMERPASGWRRISRQAETRARRHDRSGGACSGSRPSTSPMVYDFEQAGNRAPVGESAVTTHSKATCCPAQPEPTHDLWRGRS
jgi:hypothetical protein